MAARLDALADAPRHSEGRHGGRKRQDASSGNIASRGSAAPAVPQKRKRKTAAERERAEHEREREKHKEIAPKPGPSKVRYQSPLRQLFELLIGAAL